RLPHALVVVPQPRGLSTAEVYSRADELGLSRADAELERLRFDLGSALESGPGLPPRLVVNDLEAAAVSLCPAVAAALRAVRSADAGHALVSGSGPTVAGIYWGEDGNARAEDAAAKLREAYPAACVALPVERVYGSPVPVG